jgi:hypothetical protein
MVATMVSKLLGRSVRWASALLVAPALVAGCAENYASVEIRQFMVAQANPASPLACTVAPDPSGTKVLSSILDVALRDNYVAFPLIQNNMFQTRSAEFNRPDQRAITAQFVDVELTTADGMTRLTLSNAGAPVPSSYRIPVRSDLIPAGNGTTPGFGVMEMPLIPASVGLALRERLGCTGFVAGAPPAPFCANDSQTIRVTVRPTFRTVGGQELSGAAGSTWTNVSPYTFPLTVCCGCLLSFPSNVDARCQMMMGSMSSTSTTGYCLIGQDFPTLCTSCAGRPECSREGC